MIRWIRHNFAKSPTRFAFRLMLATLVLRALIPVGYMFNYAAASEGGPLIILCPSGIEQALEGTVVEGLMAGHTHHDAQGDTASQDRAHSFAPCVFTALAALAVALALVLSLFPAGAMRLGRLPTLQLCLPNFAALGPIGPRAPPIIL